MAIVQMDLLNGTLDLGVLSLDSILLILNIIKLLIGCSKFLMWFVQCFGLICLNKSLHILSRTALLGVLATFGESVAYCVLCHLFCETRARDLQAGGYAYRARGERDLQTETIQPCPVST